METINNLFKDIFPDYNTFKEWYSEVPLSDDFGEEKTEEYIYKDVPNLKTFTLIAFKYNDSRTSMSMESFKQNFANELYTYYKEFEETTKAIEELMKLSDEAISTDNYMVTNVADIPETTRDTDTETVDFISQQQKMIQKKGTLRIKREQISNKRALTTKTFINRFRHLFIRILSYDYNHLVKEDE